MIIYIMIVEKNLKNLKYDKNKASLVRFLSKNIRQKIQYCSFFFLEISKRKILKNSKYDKSDRS